MVCGTMIETYEQAFASALGSQFAVSFSSGRVALFAILRAHGVGRGDDVLLQVPTHVVVANAIRYAGANPIYIDCEPKTYNIDLAAARKAITRRTRLLVLQHTFGVPARIDEALDLAREHDFAVVEDCVHALGSQYSGRFVGTFGRAAFFSTEETKTISTTMGGVAVTDDAALAREIRDIQAACPRPARSTTRRYLIKFVLYHLLTHPSIHRAARSAYEATGNREPLSPATSDPERNGLRPSAYAQRFSNAQAALGLRQLARLEANLAHRRAIGATYAERLRGAGLDTPEPPAAADPVFVRYPVAVADRGRVIQQLSRRVALGRWFSSVLQESARPEVAGYVRGSCPQAEKAATHLVNLPTHPRVTLEDARSIVTALIDAAGEARN
jgi:perosamine synthetase